MTAPAIGSAVAMAASSNAAKATTGVLLSVGQCGHGGCTYGDQCAALAVTTKNGGRATVNVPMSELQEVG